MQRRDRAQSGDITIEPKDKREASTGQDLLRQIQIVASIRSYKRRSDLLTRRIYLYCFINIILYFANLLAEM